MPFLKVLIVLLADVFVRFPAFPPSDIKTRGPRLGICFRVVDSGFVMQRVLVGTGVALSYM